MPHAVQRSVRQFVRSLTEAVLIVLAVSLVSLGLRTGLVVAVSIPLVLAITFLFMWLLRHRPAQDLARGADPVAGAAGRRRDHRRRDDGDQAGAGLRPLPRRELRLHEHRVPDAHRDARHRRRLPAHRDREELDRRVHALAVRGVGDRAGRVVGRRGHRDPVPRLPDAARLHQGAARIHRRAPVRAAARTAGAGAAGRRARRSGARLRHAVLSPLSRARRLVRRAPEDRDRRDAAGVRRVARRVPLRAAAVLPVVVAARADRRPAAPRGQLVRGDARSGEEDGGDARPRARRRQLRRLRRRRQPALLPAARPAAAAVEFRAVRAGGRQQRRARAAARAADRAVRRRLPGAARPRVAARERSAGRLPGPVPRLGRGPGEGARHRAAR